VVTNERLVTLSTVGSGLLFAGHATSNRASGLYVYAFA
jgi:hypothetical protein